MIPDDLRSEIEANASSISHIESRYFSGFFVISVQVMFR